MYCFWCTQTHYLKTSLFFRPFLENCISIIKWVYLCNHKVYLNTFGVIVKGKKWGIAEMCKFQYICYWWRVNEDDTQKKIYKMNIRLKNKSYFWWVPFRIMLMKLKLSIKSLYNMWTLSLQWLILINWSRTKLLRFYYKISRRTFQNVHFWHSLEPPATINHCLIFIFTQFG